MEISFSAAAIALLLGLLPLWLLLLSKTQKKEEKKKKKRYAPVAGFTWSLIFNYRRIHDYFVDQSRKSKCFRILHPGFSYVYLTNPPDLEHILSTNFSNFGKGFYNRDCMGDFLGDGIFAADGEIWRHQRKLASHEFSTRNLKESSSLVFKSTAGKLAQAISDATTANRPLDIKGLLMKATMDSTFKIAFGVSLNILGGADEESARFSEAFDNCNDLIYWRYVDLSWKVKRFLNVGCEAALRKNIKIVDDFVYKIIARKIEQINEEERDSGSLRKYDILSRFLVEREKEPDKISLTYLRDIILNFVVAGKDTAAGVMSWFFYRMCKHPDLQKKLREEVDGATGESLRGLSMADFAEQMGDVISLPYLHAALSETLRLHPAVPLDPKMCFSDDTLPSGYDVKGGDIVIYAPYSMGRRRDLWGDDAEEFRPERWLDENGSIRHESAFKFPAFQAGPRVCLGREFAYAQMKIFAAVLLHFFEFEFADDGKDVRYRTTMTLQIEGLRVKAIPREFQR